MTDANDRPSESDQVRGLLAVTRLTGSVVQVPVELDGKVPFGDCNVDLTPPASFRKSQVVHDGAPGCAEFMK
ncbi:hypothetical protein [Glycomyces tritici]|uniref:Uncharacterized protein n=1 Tax=Glycomyces tritici TaxID=2665176 RepID=A0ABT7YU68_9ACTN|nr:hypothetical protein [Glycomyces tritici]MDN3241384.1 hypothetical protein [Glycomyces tritici]MDN3242132.1 hypothetical protein [Glycomyces tritici]